MQPVNIQDLIEAGVHFGCRVSRWNPKMAPYIRGRRNLVHIIDLRETIRGLLRAENVLYHLAAEGSQILWVGTKRQVRGVVQETGQRTGMPVVIERWIGGTLTNFSVIRSRLRRLEELESMEEDGTMAQLKKKEISSLRRQKRKIIRNLGGIREMTGIPGAMVVVDPAREANAVREARKMGVAVIGLIDTDSDPETCDIGIPGNNDGVKSVRLLIERLAAAVEEGAANVRLHIAAMGSAKPSEDVPLVDQPRPTRAQRPPRPRSAHGSEGATLGERSPRVEAVEDDDGDELIAVVVEPPDEAVEDDDDGDELIAVGVGARSGRSSSTTAPAVGTTSSGASFSFDSSMSAKQRRRFLQCVREVARERGVRTKLTSGGSGL